MKENDKFGSKFLIGSTSGTRHIRDRCRQFSEKQIVNLINSINMKIQFNRRKVETICIFLSFILVLLLVILGIVAIADGIFSWDILSENLENVAVLFMSAIGIIIGATFLISLMVNFSLISISLEKIADKFNSNNKQDE
jgi:hypothetical protein